MLVAMREQHHEPCPSVSSVAESDASERVNWPLEVSTLVIRVVSGVRAHRMRTHEQNEIKKSTFL